MPDIAALFVFPLFLVFCRMGAALFIFPGFSDPSINARARLLAAGGISLMLWPMVAEDLPPLPAENAIFVQLILIELVIGLLMGIAARLLMGALSVAGEMIAFATGFQAATLFDPITNSNSTAPSLFLMLVGGVLIFAMNLHHDLIHGVYMSYQVFPPGQLPPVNDTAQAIINTVQHLFVLGVKMAAPVVVIGFLGYVGFGIFNRLIPQLHVFFVALPLQIFVGMFVLATSIAIIFTLFVTHMKDRVILFVQ